MEVSTSEPAILHICLASSWGGQEIWAFERAEEQRNLGLQVYVARRQGTPLDEKCTKAGIDGPIYSGGLDRFLFPLKVRRFTKDRGVRVVHAHHLRGLTRGALALTSCRIVLTEHAFRERTVYDPLARLALTRTDIVHAISPQILEANGPRLGVAPEVITVLGHGTDTSRFSPTRMRERRADARHRFDMGPEDFVLALPGRLSPAKNQLLVLEAIARLGLPDLRLILAGERTRIPGSHGLEYPKQIEQFIEAQGLEDRVLLPGFVDPVDDVYAAADIVCMPSHNEAFGLVCIEALACGLPLLVGAGGALPSLVGHPQGIESNPSDPTSFGAAIVLDPRSPENWAHWIVDLHENRELRELLKDRARTRAVEEFDLHRAQQRLLELYGVSSGDRTAST